MARQPVDSFRDHHRAGVFDVTFEGKGWEARGWVPSYLPVTIVVMDGEREVCLGRSGLQLVLVPRAEGCAPRHPYPARFDRLPRC